MKAIKTFAAILIIFIISNCSNEGINHGFEDFYSKEQIFLDEIEQIDYREKVIKSNFNLLNHRESLFSSFSGRFLLNNDLSQISLFVYSSDYNLNGSLISLKANKVEPSTLEIELFTSENNSFKLCKIPFAISDSGYFDLDLQFNNSINGGDLAIWNRYKSPTNKGLRSDAIYNLSTAVCTSRNQVTINSFGQGTAWGVILNFAKLYKLERGAPYEF